MSSLILYNVSPEPIFENDLIYDDTIYKFQQNDTKKLCNIML